MGNAKRCEAENLLCVSGSVHMYELVNSPYFQHFGVDVYPVSFRAHDMCLAAKFILFQLIFIHIFQVYDYVTCMHLMCSFVLAPISFEWQAGSLLLPFFTHRISSHHWRKPHFPCTMRNPQSITWPQSQQSHEDTQAVRPPSLRT